MQVKSHQRNDDIREDKTVLVARKQDKMMHLGHACPSRRSLNDTQNFDAGRSSSHKVITGVWWRIDTSDVLTFVALDREVVKTRQKGTRIGSFQLHICIPQSQVLSASTISTAVAQRKDEIQDTNHGRGENIICCIFYRCMWFFSISMNLRPLVKRVPRTVARSQTRDHAQGTLRSGERASQRSKSRGKYLTSCDAALRDAR